MFSILLYIHLWKLENISIVSNMHWLIFEVENKNLLIK